MKYLKEIKILKVDGEDLYEFIQRTELNKKFEFLEDISPKEEIFHCTVSRKINLILKDFLDIAELERFNGTCLLTAIVEDGAGTELKGITVRKNDVIVKTLLSRPYFENLYEESGFEEFLYDEMEVYKNVFMSLYYLKFQDFPEKSILDRIEPKLKENFKFREFSYDNNPDLDFKYPGLRNIDENYFSKDILNFLKYLPNEPFYLFLFLRRNPRFFKYIFSSDETILTYQKENLEDETDEDEEFYINISNNMELLKKKIDKEYLNNILEAIYYEEIFEEEI